VSPLEVAIGARDRPGGEEFCRQLAWRDFFYQVTAAFPDMARKNYRPGPSWHEDEDALQAWRTGRTGIPIVDAGMRQLAAEGFMHNRARMITASFLTRNLGIDWRHGYRHFAPCWPTATWPATRATGSGWPGPATTPGPTG
jgi:deoxyribodipyrimidine photo-lyase